MKEFIEKLIGRLEERRLLHAELAQSEKLTDEEQMIQARFCGCFSKAKAIVNELAEEYNNGWIACSERLPEDFMGFEYLTVKRNHTGVNISYFCVANHKWYESRNSKREVDVVMWHDIPLPQPYKENENGKI